MRFRPPSRIGRGGYLIGLLGLVHGGLAFAQEPAPRGEIRFDRETLRSLGLNIDVSAFERSADALPAGTYPFHVTVNGVSHGRMDVRVTHAEDARQVYCFTRDQLEPWGIALQELPQARLAALERECVDLLELIPQARVEPDLSVATLDVTVPHAYIRKRPRHYSPPGSWDTGLNAGFLSYNANLDRNHGDRQADRESFFVGLNGGLNVSGWRLRHNGSLRDDGGAGHGGRYRTLNNYAQRDLTAWSSQLTLGEYFTRGDLFDSIPFTGVQMETDERMLPENERGFAPQVRGVAESNATVTVRQGDQVIYETTVAPGPFLIDDLYNSGYTENLQVTITESDGREKRFAVPYSYAAELLRPGSARYFLTGGRYRGEGVGREPAFVQGGYRRGVANAVTLYAGGVAAEHYRAALLGSGFNTRFGAVTADATFSDFDPETANAAGAEAPSRGMSYRVGYHKTFGLTGTAVRAIYRHSDRDHLGLSAALETADTGPLGALRERERLTLNVNQALGSRTSFYLSGVAQTYWTGEEDSITFSAGFSRSFRWATLGLSASRFDTADGHDLQYLATLSLPLGRKAGAPYLNATMAYLDHDNHNLQASLSGSVGDALRTSYNLYGNSGLDNGHRSHAYGASARVRTSASTVGASVSRGDGFGRESLSARGSVAAYRDGLAFSPGQGETMAIVEAEGAEGAQLRRNQVRIGGSGKALVTGLTPYRRNEIVLDPGGSAHRVEIEQNIQNIAPRYGAIVRVPYKTTVGAPALLALAHADGMPIPFGATVADARGETVAHVAQGQLVLLRTGREAARYRVSWRSQGDLACTFTYAPAADAAADDAYRRIPVTCSAEPDRP